MKSRHVTAILSAYKAILAKLCAAGLQPKLQGLDNEGSAVLETYMHDQDIDFRLVPPGVHRRDAAERVIHNFKSHFITGLCSIDKRLPTSTFGTNSYPKPSSASTSSVDLESTQKSPLGHNYSVTMISKANHSALRSRCASHRTQETRQTIFFMVSSWSR